VPDHQNEHGRDEAPIGDAHGPALAPLTNSVVDDADAGNRQEHQRREQGRGDHLPDGHDTASSTAKQEALGAHQAEIEGASSVTRLGREPRSAVSKYSERWRFSEWWRRWSLMAAVGVVGRLEVSCINWLCGK
jgi:hypothetical protein